MLYLSVTANRLMLYALYGPLWTLRKQWKSFQQQNRDVHKVTLIMANEPICWKPNYFVSKLNIHILWFLDWSDQTTQKSASLNHSITLYYYLLLLGWDFHFHFQMHKIWRKFDPQVNLFVKLIFFLFLYELRKYVMGFSCISLHETYLIMNSS